MSLVTCTWVEQLIHEKHLVALNGIMFRFLQEKVYSGKIGCNWPHTNTHNTTGSLETAESYLLVQGLWHSSYIRRSFLFRSQRNLCHISIPLGSLGGREYIVYDIFF